MEKEKLLKAIEFADEGNWEMAHQTVQDMDSEYAYWIHANLHREEGDISNSKYWYSRAGKSYTDGDFKSEREAIKNEIEKNL